MTETRRSFHALSRAAGDGIARHGPCGRRHRLRRLHRPIESGLKQLPGRHRRAAEFHQPPAARRLGATARSSPARSSMRSNASAIAAHPFEAAARRSRQRRRGALADALPCGRGLRRDEHHAAVGVGLVRQCHRHHAGDARPVSLAVGADRAAGGGLCRPAVLSQRLAARCAIAPLNMDVPISLGVIAGARHVARTRPPTTPSTPISIPRSCCCSSCCAAACSTTRCAARRARSPAISRR